MGVEAWIAGISAIVGAGASYESSRKQKQASKDQKEAEMIARNEQRAQDTLSRRAQIREERIRRAQIMQSAQNMGAGGSSGEMGSISSLSASIGANLSNISRGARTADHISYFQQSAQDNIDSANNSLAIGNTIQSWLSGGLDAYQAPQKSKGQQTPSTTVTPVQQ